jgi:nucleoside-diphosphate-sugar epimerase
MQKLFVIGCGDIGLRTARMAKQQGIEPTGLIRSTDHAERLTREGIHAMLGNLDEPESLRKLDLSGSLALYSVPPPGGGITDPRAENFCAALSATSKPAKLVYLSTSGVYGDCGETLVTEETVPNPQTARAKRRLAAEQTFLRWGSEQGVAIVILRVTGIYGPGRIPMDKILGRHPLLNEQEAPLTNRIHADDLATVCLAALLRGGHGEIFNVSDGESSTMTAYFNAIADMMGVQRAPQVSLAEARGVMTPLMFSYMTESRRMDNRKMLERLGVTLRYPTLDKGLKAVFSETVGGQGEM